MKRHKLFFLTIILALLLNTILYNSCGKMNQQQQTLGGTGTGNPVIPPDPSLPSSDQTPPPYGGAQSPASMGLLNVLCDNVIRCFPSVDKNDCETQLLRSSSIQNKLGLDSRQFVTYEQVVLAEQNHIFVIDTVVLHICYEELNSASCPQISKTSDIFSSIDQFFPLNSNQCSLVFKTEKSL